MHSLRGFNGLPNGFSASPYDFKGFAKEYNACPNRLMVLISRKGF